MQFIDTHIYFSASLPSHSLPPSLSLPLFLSPPLSPRATQLKDLKLIEKKNQIANSAMRVRTFVLVSVCQVFPGNLTPSPTSRSRVVAVD